MHVYQIDVVVGGQYGSEGKGAVAGAMVDRFNYDVLIRVAGPNAGHSTVGKDGIKYAFRQIPAAGVRDYEAALFIGPGSEVDLEVLVDEIDRMDRAGIPVRNRLYVSPEATILTEQHHQQEADDAGFGKEGSTRKGVGAARCARLMRRAGLARDVKGYLDTLGVVVGEPPGPKHRAMLEGTQGYWLGSHAGMYPFCTSSDCRAIDFLAMSGCTFRMCSIMVVMRSYPIRIAGNSGPLEDETSWEALGLEPEITTVTKKVRRVGQWEPSKVRAALDANWVGPQPPVVAMTFMDYVADTPEGQRHLALSRIPDSYPVVYIGNGPDTGEWLL